MAHGWCAACRERCVAISPCARAASVDGAEHEACEACGPAFAFRSPKALAGGPQSLRHWKAPTTLEGDPGSDAFAESPRVHVASVEDEERVACAAPFVGSPRTRARARAAYVRIFCPNLRRATNPNLTE